jgi:hypothetical protein
VRRDAFEDCPEEAWLGGGFVDSGVSTATRQAAYDNQGVGVVETGTNATLDLGTGLTWNIRDAVDDTVVTYTEAAATTGTTIEIGTSDASAGSAVSDQTLTVQPNTVNFTHGVTVDNGDGAINLGITQHQIDFTAAGTITGTSTMLLTAADSNVSVTTTGSAGNILVNSAGSIDMDADGAMTVNTADDLNASGNDFTLVTGSSTAGTAAGAGISMTAGNGFTSGLGGAVGITAGNGGASGTGGGITHTAGDGGGTSGSGGAFTVNAGNAITDGTGGFVTLDAGAGAGANSGGNANISAGDGGGGATGNGGSVNLNGGNSTSTNGDGGGLTVNLGVHTGTGTAGIAVIATSGSGLITEESGIFGLTNNGAGTGGGSSITQYVIESDPSSVGITANVGSLAFRNVTGGGTDGQLWLKTGGGDTDWMMVDVGATGSTLQAAYVASAGADPSITTTAALDSVSIGGTIDDVVAGGMFTVTAPTHTVPTATTAIAVTGTPNGSGSLVSITDTSTESGNALFVNNSGDGPGVIIQNTSSGNAFRVTDGITNHFTINDSGSATFIPDSNGDFTVTTSGASGIIDLNAGAGGLDIDVTAGPITIDNTGAFNISITSGQQFLLTAADEVDITSDCVGIHPNSGAEDTSSFHSEMERFQLWGTTATTANGSFVGMNTQRVSTTAKEAGTWAVLSTSATVTDTITATTAAVAVTTDAEVTVASSTGFAVGDLVTITGSASECNDDVYEVASIPDATHIRLRGPNGVTARSLTFTGLDLVTAGAGGTIQKATVSVIQTGIDGMWEGGTGDGVHRNGR